MATSILLICAIACGVSSAVRGDDLIPPHWKDEQPDLVAKLDTLYANELAEQLADERRLFPRPAARSLSSYLSFESACTCETEYEIRDLGEGHYPRYVTTSSCKTRPSSCNEKFYPCRLLHYNVHILKARDTSEISNNRYSSEDLTREDEDTEALLPEALLPEPLRRKWQLKPMTVSVACISG